VPVCESNLLEKADPSVPEDFTLDFRTEIFDLTNTPPLNAPDTVFESGAFGTIISGADPRVIQLALKLNL